jgi:translation initiation factor IF-1
VKAHEVRVSRPEIVMMGLVAGALGGTSFRVEPGSDHEILADWSLARPIAV